MSARQVGFIGLGEVTTTLSRELVRNGAKVRAFDTLSATPGGRKILEERIAGSGVKLSTLEEVAADSHYVLSAVPTQEAVSAARAASPHLKRQTIYVDMNSTSPADKIAIGRIIEASGARYVEATILGAIGAGGAATRIIIAGTEGEKVAAELSDLGLNVEYYASEVGRASMFKMLRSVFSKGLECILIELLLAGRRAGIEDDLWSEVCRFMRDHPFDTVADNWIRTHPVACERRYHEMVQVNGTLRALNLDAPMSRAAESFFLRSCGLGVGEAFQQKPESRGTVLQYLESRINNEA